MVEKIFDAALWLAGVGHFILPIAGLQLPHRLNWKVDLARLHPFNRKLMWAYLFFITFVVLSFGTLTLVFHQAFLQGIPLARGLSVFIGLFWLFRVLIDFFYFEHKDWPPGFRFILGHLLLITLDILLAATYLGLAIWHFFSFG
jgi:alginate O-acetyltransferase complex protein AlgI